MQRKIRPFRESEFGCREFRALRVTVFRFADGLYLPFFRDGGFFLFFPSKLISEKNNGAVGCYFDGISLSPPRPLVVRAPCIRGYRDTGACVRACSSSFVRRESPAITSNYCLWVKYKWCLGLLGYMVLCPTVVHSPNRCGRIPLFSSFLPLISLSFSLSPHSSNGGSREP